MLDKNIPYAGFFMCRSGGRPLPPLPPLPEGYKFAFYKDGDEISWAKLETSVLEFESEFAALMRFKQDYFLDVNELYNRCVFIEDDVGNKVATGTAWWGDIENKRRPWIQWISVCPQHQGKGLGKAVIARVAEVLLELEGDVDMILKTQTWSYKAIKIYKALGFEPTDEKALYRNGDIDCNYKKAMKILKKLDRVMA